MRNAKKSCDLFDSNVEDPDSVAFLYKAMYNMNVAQSLYYSNYLALENNDIEEVFYQFDVFAQEFIEQFALNGSHSWTNNYFEELQKAYDKLKHSKE